MGVPVVTNDNEVIWLNVGCGPHRAPKPWINLDCHRGDSVEPDVLVDIDAPVAMWDRGSVDRVYLGHVLEHVEWPKLPAFLSGIRRVLKPDGELLAVGPDVRRTIQGWKDGVETWELVLSVLEESSGGVGEVGDWPAGTHKWNCHEARVVALLEANDFADVRAVPMPSSDMDNWPVVSRAPWQMAVFARHGFVGTLSECASEDLDSIASVNGVNA